MEELNEDILGIIISHLDIEDILILRCVNKKFNGIISSSIIKRTITEPSIQGNIWKYGNATLYRIIDHQLGYTLYKLKTRDSTYYSYQYVYCYSGDQFQTCYKSIYSDNVDIIFAIYKRLNYNYYIIERQYFFKNGIQVIHKSICNSFIDELKNAENAIYTKYDTLEGLNDLYTLNKVREFIEKYKI